MIRNLVSEIIMSYATEAIHINIFYMYAAGKLPNKHWWMWGYNAYENVHCFMTGKAMGRDKCPDSQ